MNELSKKQKSLIKKFITDNPTYPDDGSHTGIDFDGVIERVNYYDGVESDIESYYRLLKTASRICI